MADPGTTPDCNNQFRQRYANIKWLVIASHILTGGEIRY